jgi:hypothetical protein
MCQKLARALRDLLARYRNPHLQRPTLYPQQTVCQNSIMKQSYGPPRIFLLAFLRLDSPKYCQTNAKPYVAAPGTGQAGMPMGPQA